MNRQEQLLELENEIAKANKEIDNLKSGMTSGQMISVIFLFISIFMIFILSGFFVKFFGFILAFLSILGIIGASNQKSERVSWLEQRCTDLACEVEKAKQKWSEEDKKQKSDSGKKTDNHQEFTDKEIDSGLVWKRRFTVVGTFYRDSGEIPFYKLQKDLDHLETVKTNNFQFKPEPDNPYHGNAIKVIVEGYFVGYVPRELANQLIHYMEPSKYRIEGYVRISKVSLKRGKEIKYAVVPKIYTR